MLGYRGLNIAVVGGSTVGSILGTIFAYRVILKALEPRRKGTGRQGYVSIVGKRITDVIFEYKEDAESILKQMKNICDTYGWVSVLDFYDIAGIPERINYSYNNYGWDDVDGATIRFKGTGYVIALPSTRIR